MTKINNSDRTKYAESLQDSQVNDELRMRFTGWLKIVVKRAKIDYVRRRNRHQGEISIEDVSAYDALVYDWQDASAANFDFENDQIAFAFSKLTPVRSQILIMLFVQNLTPQEIADDLHCSVQHVYNQRSLALKELKQILRKENE